MRFRILVLLFLSATACAQQGERLTHTTTPGGLNSDEQRIVSWVGDHMDEFEALLEAQVNMNSGTMNPTGVRAVSDALAKQFDAIGFDTRWIALPESAGRSGHLFASIDGDKGPKILAIGHLDTVFEPGDAFNRYQHDGNIARGPGIADMKSGNLIILFALRALRENGLLDGAQIQVAFTGDEENPGEPLSVVRKDLIAAGEWADIALGFEGGARDVDDDGNTRVEYATIARRSSSDWIVEVTGKQAHSSVIFSDNVGAGAAFEASRILHDFYELVRGEEYLTFNAGSILAGTDVDYDAPQTRGTVFGKTNVVPSRAVVHGGIRTISNEQLERARQKMRAIVADNLPGTSATIRFGEGYPAMSPTVGNQALQAMLSDINQSLGGTPMPALDPSRRGAADISFVAPLTDSLAGLGAYGSGAHSPREALELDSVPLATQRAALLLYRLIHGGYQPALDNKAGTPKR
ncbi:MAG: M20/M25/M40 family metallo-hydrolase [Pseudomonadota bacterium]